MNVANKIYLKHFKHQSNVNYLVKTIVIEYTFAILNSYNNCKSKQNNVPLDLFDKVFCKVSVDEAYGHINVLLSSIYVGKDELASFQALCDLIANFSNTVLFRSYRNKKGRLISIINHQLNKIDSDGIKKVHSKLLHLFSMKTVKSSSYSSVGVTKKSFNKNKLEKLVMNCSAVVKLDINKFYDSINAKKFVDNKIMFNLVSTSMVGPGRNKLGDYPSFTEIYNRNKRVFHNLFFYSAFDLPVNNMFRNGDENTFTVVNKDVDFDKMHIINYQMLIMVLSFVTHNNRIPTGAIYSPALSNLFMNGFDMDVVKYINEMRNSGANISAIRYIDDLTFFIYKGVDNPFDIAKSVEPILNKYGLYLNYSKTCVQYKDKGNITVLGSSFSNKNALPTAKYRKEILDMFRNKDIDIKNHRELGKVSHVFYLGVFMPDLLMHINYEHKANEFSNLCNDKDYSYKSFIHDIRKGRDLTITNKEGFKIFRRDEYLRNITSRRRFKNAITAVIKSFDSELISDIRLIKISNSFSNEKGETGRYIDFKLKLNKKKDPYITTGIFIPDRVLDKFAAV